MTYGNKPKLIGPDRATVQHTINLLESYSGAQDYIRPGYLDFVDIVGTQSRYNDKTAVRGSFRELTQDGTSTTQVFCTMCSQEWYRQVNMPLAGEAPYNGRQTYTSFWEGYSKYRGEAQAPANQALLAGLTGYVAEAAVPRFIDRFGKQNTARMWNQNDLMVNIDDRKESLDETVETLNREEAVPASGLRTSFGQMVFSTACQSYGTEKDDRILEPYGVCAIEFTQEEFDLNRGNPITMYVDHPYSVYSFVETCETDFDQQCTTSVLEQGNEFTFYPSTDKVIRLIFENDSEIDVIFTVAYEGIYIDLAGAFSSLKTVGLASAIALASVLSF